MTIPKFSRFANLLTDPSVISGLFFCCTLVIPNNKAFFLLCSLFFLWLFFLTKSLIQTILLCFIPFSTYSIGQNYLFPIIPPESVDNGAYPEGRFLRFIFSPTTVLYGVSLYALLIWSLIKRRELFGKNLYLLTLMLVMLSNLVSAVMTPYLPTLSVLYVLSTLGSVVIVVLLVGYLRSVNSGKQHAFFTTVSTQISFALGLQLVVSLLQILKRSTLGITIEAVEAAPQFVGASDQIHFLFRPLGLTSHPNNLAYWTLLHWWALITLSQFINKKLLWNRVRKIGIGAGLLLIILSQSRAAYSVLGIGVLVWFVFGQQNGVAFLKTRWEAVKKNRWIIGALLVLFSLVAVRTFQTVDSFSENGGLVVRKLTFDRALQLIEMYPIFGVGPGMFIPASFVEIASDYTRYIFVSDLKNKAELILIQIPFLEFPEAVHFGLILYLTETGIIGLLLYGLSQIFLIKTIIRLPITQIQKSILLLGLLGQQIFALFHPTLELVTVQLFVYSAIITVVEVRKTSYVP